MLFFCQKLYEKEDISVLDQDKINFYYAANGRGDSGAGVIINGGPMGGDEDTRSTILAVVKGAVDFASFFWTKKQFSSKECTNKVSRLAHNELEWMKLMDRKHYLGGKNADIKYLFLLR